MENGRVNVTVSETLPLRIINAFLLATNFGGVCVKFRVTGIAISFTFRQKSLERARFITDTHAVDPAVYSATRVPRCRRPAPRVSDFGKIA